MQDYCFTSVYGKRWWNLPLLSGMAKFEKYSEGKIIFKNAQLEKNAES